MDFDVIILVGIQILTLAFSIYYLIRGKQIKIVCKGGNKVAICVIYVLLAILILIKEFKKINIITACIVMLSGIIYSLVPSGYDEKGVYLSGRLYPYEKISDMEFDYVNGYYQLAFTYKGKSHVLLANPDDKEKLKGALYFYNNSKKM